MSKQEYNSLGTMYDNEMEEDTKEIEEEGEGEQDEEDGEMDTQHQQLKHLIQTKSGYMEIQNDVGKVEEQEEDEEEEKKPLNDNIREHQLILHVDEIEKENQLNASLKQRSISHHSYPLEQDELNESVDEIEQQEIRLFNSSNSSSDCHHQEVIVEEINRLDDGVEEIMDDFEDIELEESNKSTPSLEKIHQSPFKQLSMKLKSFSSIGSLQKQIQQQQQLQQDEQLQEQQQRQIMLSDQSDQSLNQQEKNIMGSPFTKYNTFPNPSTPASNSKTLNNFIKLSKQSIGGGSNTNGNPTFSPQLNNQNNNSNNNSNNNNISQPNLTFLSMTTLSQHLHSMNNQNNNNGYNSNSGGGSNTNTISSSTSISSSIISSTSSSMSSSPSNTVINIRSSNNGTNTSQPTNHLETPSKILASLIPPNHHQVYNPPPSPLLSSITRPVLSHQTTRISTPILTLLALSTFFSISNLYYIQPLINVVGEQFNQTESIMSLTSMSVQLGYAFGLLFISIIGDIISKKKLLLLLSVISSLSLVGVGLSPNVIQMIIFQFIVGCSSIVPHIAIPLAQDLTNNPNERTSGIILMSSLFAGMLGARVLSGIIGAIIGWQYLYFLTAGIIFIISLLLFILLPYTPRIENPIPYSELLKSIFQLIKKEPTLQQTCFVGSLIFGAYWILWTTLSFRLNNDPYNYSSGFIGLFGLVGMSGAIATPMVRKLSKHFSVNVMVILSLVICAVGFTVLLLFDQHVSALIGGIFILDLGVQSCHITNQSRNYKLNDRMKSRINISYMTSYFIGGAIGSGISGILFEVYGWNGTSIVSLVFLGLSLCYHLIKYNHPKNIKLEVSLNDLSISSIRNHNNSINSSIIHNNHDHQYNQLDEDEEYIY